MSESFAAIDLGSNSTRLLISSGPSADQILDRRLMTVTRLGEGVDVRRLLSDAAIARTVECLRAYRSELDAAQVPIDNRHLSVVATSAARDATNREDFFDECEAVLGVRPRLLTGVQEGELCFAGATSGLTPQMNLNGEPELDLVIDIGGGSTEFVVGVAGGAPLRSLSIDAGCVRFTEKYLQPFDPPGPEALSSVVTVMRAHLDDVDRDLPEARTATRMIGLAGSITTVAAVEIGMSTYDRDRLHHFVLTRAAAEDVFRTLATEARSDRAFNPGLAPDRVDTIVAGAAILVTIMRHYGLDSLLVSETDILDGIVASLRLT